MKKSDLKNKELTKKKNTDILELKNVMIENHISFKKRIELKQKEQRNFKLKEINRRFEIALENLKAVIDLQKELKNKTEYWENKQRYQYDFYNWNKIRKMTTFLTRYYNELKEIKEDKCL